MWLGEEAPSEQRRLAVTLLVSSLLHVCALTLIKLPPKDHSGTGHPVLTVVFKTLTVAAAVATAPEPVAVFRVSAVETPLQPQSPPPPRLRAQDVVRPAKPVAAPALVPVVPLPVSKPVAKPSPPAPGRDARTASASGGVSVLMTIGEGGRIDQIFWKTLPALTNEQFQRLESILRVNQYAESQIGTTVTEIVDVRGILGLPPASGEAAPVATQHE